MTQIYSRYLGHNEESINLANCYPCVYVKEVLAHEFMYLTGGSDQSFDDNELIYVAFEQDGSHVAMADDRDLAFVAARHLNKNPVSTH